MLTQEKHKKILFDKFSDENILIKDEYIEISVPESEIFNSIKYLKENFDLKYDQLIDLTAVDYPSNEKRFVIIYILLSMTLNRRIIIKSSIKENYKLQSIISIHRAADWYERECYDLFGIQFLNHPDLRRIMTDYNFEGHPLRKDFPLTGHTEVRYDDLEKKVIYEPVKLTQEFRNFDYMSPWEGFDNKLIGDEKSEEESDK